MAAKKKTTPKSKKKLSTSQKYIQERDSFFKDHPNAQILLGLFVVAIAIFVGARYYNYRLKMQVTEYLLETEGVFVDPRL